jgi:hypothetical protein
MKKKIIRTINLDKSKPNFMVQEFIKFFEGQGFKFVDVTPKVAKSPPLTLCPHCYCMTKTVRGLCGKCGEKK